MLALFGFRDHDPRPWISSICEIGWSDAHTEEACVSKYKSPNGEHACNIVPDALFGIGRQPGQCAEAGEDV